MNWGEGGVRIATDPLSEHGAVRQATAVSTAAILGDLNKRAKKHRNSSR